MYRFTILLSALLMTTPVFATEQKLKVVASFSILGDMLREIGGDKVEITTIVGSNEDAHQYQPRPHDVKQIKKADLIFINGLHFEMWFDKLLKSSHTKATVITATQGVKPRILEGKIPDPHCWHNLDLAQTYIKNIKKALIDKLPQHKKYFDLKYANFSKKIYDIHETYKKKFNKIPSKKRVVITSHDAFHYLGDAYGIKFISPLGVNTDSEPSPKEIQKVIRTIKKLKIKALFAEASIDARLIKQIARESKVTVGGELFSDALSNAKQPASTFLKMAEHNLGALLKALS